MASISASDLIGFGEQYIGTPYQWGGTSLTSGVDCSGLVQQIYANFGISLPRTTYQQIGVGTAVDFSHLQPGDILFFSAGQGGSSPDHEALYIGGGQMLEAPKPGENVRVTSVTQSYYASRFVGARRIAGVDQGQGTGNYSFTNGNSVAANLDPQTLAAEYGWNYAFLKSNPDLDNIFTQAVAQTWSTSKFAAAIKDTNWWKDNSATARQLQVQQYTDPATYNASVNATTTEVLQMAGQMGAPINSATATSIAKAALAGGYQQNTGMLDSIIGKYVDFYNKGTDTLGGTAGAFATQLKQYATQQGVTLDDQTTKNQAALIAQGMLTQDDAQEQVRQAAMSKYPAYAQQIQGGATMTDIAQPYAQTASQLLEQPVSNFTLQNPLIHNALTQQDQSGAPTGQTLTDFEAGIKKSPQWLQTNNAQQSLMSVGRSVLQNMGLSQ
jgi:hypothetical protein